MAFEIPPLGKCLPAMTREIFHSIMNRLFVPSEIPSLAKRLAAVLAIKVFHFIMNGFLMSPQIPGLAKRFSAVLAAKIPQFLVNRVFVPSQISGFLERLAAKRAVVTFLVIVDIRFGSVLWDRLEIGFDLSLDGRRGKELHGDGRNGLHCLRNGDRFDFQVAILITNRLKGVAAALTRYRRRHRSNRLAIFWAQLRLALLVQASWTSFFGPASQTM